MPYYKLARSYFDGRVQHSRGDIVNFPKGVKPPRKSEEVDAPKGKPSSTESSSFSDEMREALREELKQEILAELKAQASIEAEVATANTASGGGESLDPDVVKDTKPEDEQSSDKQKAKAPAGDAKTK